METGHPHIHQGGLVHPRELRKRTPFQNPGPPQYSGVSYEQMGIPLVVLAICDALFSFFALKSIIWEFLFVLVWIVTVLWIPDFKGILKVKLHWRIALLFAVFCTFAFVWQFISAVSPLQNYSLAMTLLLFGTLAFLFHFLDNIKSGVK